MSTQVQIRRGTTAQHSSFTGAVAELTYDSDLKTVRVHDGSTAGGTRLTKTADLTTANVAELNNLYFTNARAQALITPAYDKANTAYLAAVAAFDSGNTKVATVAGVTSTSITNVQIASGVNQTGILTTANVSEVTNLYYTDARVQSNVTTFLTGSAIKTISGNLNVTGNLNVAGSITTLTSNVITINDPMIYLGADNPADVSDIGFVGSFTNPDYQHTGFVRDASDGVWKLFANVSTEPTNNTLDFTNATYSSIQVGALSGTTGTFSGNVVAGNVSATRSIATYSNVGTVQSGTWQEIGRAHV